MAVPRGLVISPVLDAVSMAAALDKIITNIVLVDNLQAQIRNTAVADTHEDGKVYLLFDFLDKGTQPHWIGEGDEILASKERDFGPVWGPVFHPGTPPYDISTRTLADFENRLSTLISSPLLRFAGVKKADTELPGTLLTKIVVNALRQSMAFAESITPQTWSRVRSSYELYVNGRRNSL